MYATSIPSYANLLLQSNSLKYCLVRFYSNHYEVLGVGRLASSKEIKVAYYKKCKQIHPDKNTNNPKAHSQFVNINEAYSILSDPSSRREYDYRINSSFKYPNPTNIYRNNSPSYQGGRPKYTYSRSPFDEHFNNESVYEEQMRFYREQMRYSNFYRPGQEHAESQRTAVPLKTLLLVGVIVCGIFFFDAIFVTLIYNHDITSLEKHYAPINNRRLMASQRIRRQPENEDGTREKTGQEYEAEIDDKIRQYKEYESATNVHLYKIEK